jgi:hypothetical protein
MTKGERVSYAVRWQTRSHSLSEDGGVPLLARELSFDVVILKSRSLVDRRMMPVELRKKEACSGGMEVR